MLLENNINEYEIIISWLENEKYNLNKEIKNLELINVKYENLNKSYTLLELDYFDFKEIHSHKIEKYTNLVVECEKDLSIKNSKMIELNT